MDGIDAAAILTDGVDVFEFGQTEYRQYSMSERMSLVSAKGTWPGESKAREAADVVDTAHAEILRRFSVDAVVGYHGQTLAHDPDGGRTHQAGNGQFLANATGKDGRMRL